MNKLKLITFDATNTLLRFRKPPWHYYAGVASQHGYKCTEDEVKSRLVNSLRTMLERYPNFGKSTISWEDWWRKVVMLTFKDFIPANENINHIANKLINDYRTAKCWTVADGGENLLKLLQKDGVTLGVISNFDPRLKEILIDVNLLNYFEFVITSYEVGHSKPDLNIFMTAMKKCKIPVESFEVLHIGDDLKKDYEGARGAGWHAVLVNANLNSDTVPPSNHVFKDLKELSTAIQNKQLKL